MALGTAVIVGVGPGLGVALARAFANAGHPVAMLDIDKARLDTDAAELASTRNLICLNFASSFLHVRRWRARACSGAGASSRPAFPCPRVK